MASDLGVLGRWLGHRRLEIDLGLHDATESDELAVGASGMTNASRESEATPSATTTGYGLGVALASLPASTSGGSTPATS